jgi:hypothetical protein
MHLLCPGEKRLRINKLYVRGKVMPCRTSAKPFQGKICEQYVQPSLSDSKYQMLIGQFDLLNPSEPTSYFQRRKDAIIYLGIHEIIYLYTIHYGPILYMATGAE